MRTLQVGNVCHHSDYVRQSPVLEPDILVHLGILACIHVHMKRLICHTVTLWLKPQKIFCNVGYHVSSLYL